MAISSIFSRMWDTPASPLASAMSWARPTSSSAWCTIAVMPPRRSHRPREWAKTAALAGLAVEEDALVGHEHVVEDDEAVGHADAAAHREVADVVALRVVRRVDDAHAGRADRHGAGDGVVLLAGLHRLRRHHEQVVAQRRAADVQLGAADDHAVAAAVDDVHVRVGVALAGRRQAAVALGVGDALGDAHVGDDGVVDVGLQPVLVDRVDALQPRRRRQQRHERLVGDVEGEVHRVDDLGPLAQLLAASGARPPAGWWPRASGSSSGRSRRRWPGPGVSNAGSARRSLI